MLEKVLRREIFEPTGWVKRKFEGFLHYWELMIVSNNIRVMKPRSMRWANAVVPTRETRNTYIIFVVNPENTRQLWRTEHTRNIII